MRAVVLAVLVVLMLSGNLVHATVTATDERAIVRMVTELVGAEAQGDANRLYDRLVPDERELIPRQAFAIWLETADAVPAATPEIGEISEGRWISGLTGDRYDVVFVEYTVETGAGVRADELVLRRDGEGWRWLFPGGNREISEVTDPDAWSIAYESPYRTEIYRQIDRFWAQVFADAGLDYRPPVDMVGVRVQPTQTGCGVENDIEQMAVYYCTLDETIYYDPGFRDLVTESIGPYAWDHVIAHEWAHHVQNLLGIMATRNPELMGGMYTIEHELQADCMAAIFTQDAYARGLIDAGDLKMARTITELAGDETGTSWDDRSAHGSGEQRYESYLLGFEDGFIGCHVSLEAAG